MNTCKKLIEVAMPIKEISAESVRDKSIRHGHISTVHLWWARRPLPVCRAVVFASLVPDPLDPNCPQVFKDAVDFLLGKSNNVGDPYKPYDDIPYTSSIDKMEDNLRHRLMMFIGKFSDRYCENEKQGIKTESKELLSEASLIKWDNKNNHKILTTARKLIWISHNSSKFKTFKESSKEFEKHYSNILSSQDKYYCLMDRHINDKESLEKYDALQMSINKFWEHMPNVFDPFAGGGAIPLEAARLGCRSYGNDINPVAHIIQKGGVEYPQKYGKPISYSKNEFIKIYGQDEFIKLDYSNLVIEQGEPVAVNLSNRLSFDTSYYAKKILSLTEEKIGHFYRQPEGKSKTIAYYWVYEAICSNPSCKASVPLLNQFYLCNTKSKQVYLNPIISGKKINFNIGFGKCELETWIERKNLKCPICGNITQVKELKRQFVNHEPKPRLVAVICEGNQSKEYRTPSSDEIEVLKKLPENLVFPLENLPIGNNRDLHCIGWGITKWGHLFSNRQILFLNTIIENLNIIKGEIGNSDYGKAVITMLSIFVDRIAVANTSFGIWHTGGEKLERPMGRQAIPMVFDFPESNPFCNSSGSALNQLDWLLRYFESESSNPFYCELKNASSGEKSQFKPKYITSCITDPPYYDAIAYADLSDFFYVWLKKSLGNIFPENFATPLTPKSEECTALKHHHNNDMVVATMHFETKLLKIFDSIEHQTSDIVSIMFAHQSTEAWTTLCNSILGSRMNITGSWANDTEMTGALKSNKSFLSSSVTVACKPVNQTGTGDFKNVKEAINSVVSNKVELLFKLGFRGADLLTACFGQAVSEFGKYKKVEKIDGSEVSVAELLQISKECAFNALLKGFEGDDFTKFYIGWLQLYGFTESDFDDVAKFSRVGLAINVSDLFIEHLLIKSGNKQTLANFNDRINLKKTLGENKDAHLIDKVHRALYLFKDGNRNKLLKFVATNTQSSGDSFWRVLTSLCEVLPEASEDHKIAFGLLANKDSLLRDSKSIAGTGPEQVKLEL